MKEPVVPFFIQEIAEQPEVLQRVLDRLESPLQRWWQRRPALPSYIMTVGHGSSAHAGLYAHTLLPHLLGVPMVSVSPALWLWYRQRVSLKRVWMIGLSQSGETPDVVEVLRMARRGGAYTIALTNAAASPLAGAAHTAWVTPAGPERAIPTSKTFTAQLMVIALWAATITRSRASRRQLARVPPWTLDVLRSTAEWTAAIRRMNWSRGCLVVGRGFQECAAFETAMKLREAARVLTPGLTTMEFLHTSMALSERRLPLVVFEANGLLAPHYRRLEAVCRDAKLPTVWVTNRPTRSTFGTRVRFPQDVPEWLAPIPSTVIGQLLSAAVGLQGGWNIDGGPKLHKVTRAR